MMQKIPEKQDTKAAGFTLLEVVIALLILSVGILAIASLQVSSINGAATARFSTEAGIYAQEQLENMIGMDFDPENGIIPPELTVGAHVLTDFVGNPDTSPYTVAWNVIGPDVPVSNAVTIQMTVSWEERGIDRRITYTYVKGSSI